MQTAVAEVTPRPARIDVYRRESGHCRAVHPHADRRPPGLGFDWRFHLAHRPHSQRRTWDW
jgi:hypothetical protein